MGIFDTIKQSIAKSRARKKADQDQLDAMRKQAEMEAKVVFEEEFVKNAKLVLIAKAKKDAASLSGYQKMQATSRLRNLQKQNPAQAPGGFLNKLGTYMAKNVARREENMAKTKELREQATQSKISRVGVKPNTSLQPRRKPFAPSGFGR